jgi:hypothetical protein
LVLLSVDWLDMEVLKAWKSLLIIHNKLNGLLHLLF